VAYQATDHFGNRTWRIYTASIDAQSRDAPCGWGCVVISPRNEEMIAQGVIPPVVDVRQRAELMAAIRGLRFVQEGTSAVFVTESPYVREGLLFQKGLSASRPSDNPLDVNSLWAQLLSMVEKRNVNFGEYRAAREKHVTHALDLAQEALDAFEAGMMPLSTSSFTEFEAAGSPGSMTITTSGCGVIICIAIAGIVVASILSVLVKAIFS
jgi:ribonuclease HI